jgi:hypothetical protein
MARPDPTLVDQVTSAWRPSTPDGGVRAHPAWHDLDEEGRTFAFEQTVVQRRMESALEPRGLSTTARAVLARIQRGGAGGSTGDQTP